MNKGEFIMLNHKKKFWEKRIPTLFALFFILGGIVVTLSFVKQGTFTIGQAAPDATPQNVQITNVSDTSFSVAFTTTGKTAGGVSIEGPDGTSLASDDRLKSGNIDEPFYSHHITVGNVKPNSQYSFSLISGSETFNNSGKNYSIQTGPTIASVPKELNPIFGKAILPTGENADDTLVIITSPSTRSISTYTKSTGEFIVPLNSLRTTQGDSYATITDDTLFTITLLKQNTKTILTTTYKNAQNIAPITLSQDYDFTSTNTSTIASSGAQLQPLPPTTVKKEAITIQTPKEAQSLVDTKPLFRGTALPGKTVKITIHSETAISAETTTDNSGNWSYRPTENLAPGEHTITIETTDSAGILQRITQSFMVFASGSQISQSATPSATPTISVTPTISLSPTVTTTPAPTVTTAPPIISSTPSATITTMPPLAEPGGPTSTLALTFMSVLFIVSGAMLLFIL